jgi:hypothetical protein
MVHELLLWLSNTLSDNANINSVTHLKDQACHLKDQAARLH